MTDKQIVVSRELAENFAYGFPTLKAQQELRALLAEPVEKQGEPFGYWRVPPGRPLQGMFLEYTEYSERDIRNDLDAGCSITKLYRQARPPAKSGPWEPLSAPGQIKPGDWLHFTVGGKFICTKAKEILEAGTHREEVVYNRSRNHYFITGMAVDGTSSHKGVMIAKP